MTIEVNEQEKEFIIDALFMHKIVLKSEGKTSDAITVEDLIHRLEGE